MTCSVLKSLFLLLMFMVSAPLAAQSLQPASARINEGGPAALINPVVKSGPIATAQCDHARFVSKTTFLCLQRRQNKLQQVSADSSTTSDFTTDLVKPELMAASASRVAVVDDERLRVFDRQGRHLNTPINNLLVRPQAVAFVDRYIMVLDRSQRRFRLYDHDGAPLSEEPESIRQLQLKKPFALAGDAQGNLYIADAATDGIIVLNLETGRRLLLPIIDEGKRATLLDLSADENDRLYVLLRGKDRQYAIWILRGTELLFQFPLPATGKPSGVHTIAGAAGEISLFDAHEERLYRFSYTPSPGRVIGLQIRGDEQHVVVRWHPLQDHSIRSYVLYASDEDSGSLHKLGVYSQTGVEIKYHGKRYHRFAISAISASGIEGPRSEIATNDFEYAYRQYQDGNYTAAIRQFRSALRVDPASDSLIKYLGLALLYSGQPDQALQVFRQWQLTAGDKQQPRLLLATVLLRQQRLTEADALISDLLKSRPPVAEVLSLCAELYRLKGSDEKSIGCLRQQLARDKNDYWSRLELAKLQAQSKQRKQAVADVARIEAMAIRNKDSKLLVAVGETYGLLDEPAKAVSAIDRALSFESKMKSALVAKAKLLQAQKKYSEARSVALEMILDATLQAEGYRLIADLLVAQQRPGEAVLAYRKSVAAEPALVDAWLGMARAYQQLKNSAQLDATLVQALILHPGSFELWWMRARHEAAAGRAREALPPLHRANWLRPESVPVLTLLTRTYAELGQLEAAVLFGRRALQLTPDDLPLLELLADLSRQQGNFPQAIVYYRKALALKKNSSRYTHALGASYFDAGKFTNARHHLERARKLDAKNVSTTRLMAKTYHEMKMYSAAINLLQGLVKTRPAVEDKLYVKQLVRERAQFQKGGLGIEKIEAVPVYTSTVSAVDEIPVLNITVNNRGSRAIESFALRLYMDELLSQPVTMEIASLAPGKTTIELRAPASAVRLRPQQDKAVVAEMQISYTAAVGVVEVNRSRLVPLRGLRTMSWSNPVALDSLMPTAAQCGSDAEQVVRKSLAKGQHQLPELLIRLVSLSTLLSAHDVQLRETEARPIGTVFRLHSATQILQTREATAHDLQALAYNCMRQAGFAVQLAPTSTPVLLINSGLAWDRRSELTYNVGLLKKYEDKAWIAVDGALLASGAGHAWLNTTAVPVPITETAGKATAHNIDGDPDPEMVLSLEEEHIRWLVGRQLPAVLARMADTGETDADGIVARRLGIAAGFAANGFPELALVEYRELIRRNPYHATAHERLADLLVDQQQFRLAIDYYRAAERSNLFETNILSKEAEALQRLQPDERQQLVRGPVISPVPLTR